MTLSEATSRATKVAETLCADVRVAVKLANEADPLFGEIFEGYQREVVAFKNRLICLNGAAQRKAAQEAQEGKEE